MSVQVVGRHGLMLPPTADEQAESSTPQNASMDGRPPPIATGMASPSDNTKIARSRQAMMQSALKPLPKDSPGDSFANTPTSMGAGPKKKGILAAQSRGRTGGGAFAASVSSFTASVAKQGAGGGSVSQGAGWGNVFWAANQGSSPTLKLCLDVDQNLCDLMAHLAELGNWRSVLLEEKLLPLPHFTNFTMVTSKLTRAKGELHKSVGYLLRQVRCLLFESSSDDTLARELARIKSDPTNQLEEKVDELTEEVDELKVVLHQERGMARWKILLIQVGVELEESRWEKMKQKMGKYIVRVKDQNSPEKILQADETIDEHAGEEGAAMDRTKARAMVKKQAEKLDKRERALEKRDAKLLAERQKFTEAVMGYEEHKKEDEEELQAHISALTAAEEQHGLKMQEQDKQRKAIEEENSAMHRKWFEKATALVDKERYLDQRLPEIGEMEKDIAKKLLELEDMSKDLLRGLQSSEYASTVSATATGVLKFAAETKEPFDISTRQTLKMSQTISTGLMPAPVMESAEVQCNILEDAEGREGEAFGGSSRSDSREGRSRPGILSHSRTSSRHSSKSRASSRDRAVEGGWGSRRVSVEDGATTPARTVSDKSQEEDADQGEGKKGEEEEVDIARSLKTLPVKAPVVTSTKRRGSVAAMISPNPSLKSGLGSRRSSVFSRSSSAAFGEEEVDMGVIGGVLIPDELKPLWEAVEKAQKHQREMLLRITTTEEYIDISENEATQMILQKKQDNLAMKLRLVEEREEYCKSLEQRYSEMETEHSQMLDKKRIAEAKTSELLSGEAERLFQHEQRVAELLAEKETLDDRTRNLEKRSQDLDNQTELLMREKAFFEEKVSSLLGSKQGSASLSKLMSLEARERNVVGLEDLKTKLEQEGLILRQEQSDVKEARDNIIARENELEKKTFSIEAAISQAAEEQAVFEASVAERTQELEARKAELDAFWEEIKDSVGAEERKKEATALMNKVVDKEYKIKVKEEQMAEAMEKNLDKCKAEIAKAKKEAEEFKVDALEKARASVRKREEEVLQKEGDLNRRLQEAERDLAKSKDLAYLQKQNKELEFKMKKADEKNALLNDREIALKEATQELERVKKDMGHVDEAKLPTEFAKGATKSDLEDRIKRLLLSQKEWVSKEKTMSAHIQKLELQLNLRESRSVETLTRQSDKASSERVTPGTSGPSGGGVGLGGRRGSMQMEPWGDQEKIPELSAGGGGSEEWKDIEKEKRKLEGQREELHAMHQALQRDEGERKEKEDEKLRAIVVKERELAARDAALKGEETDAQVKAKKLESEISLSMEKMVKEHESFKRQLKVKQERLDADLHAVELEQQHVDELKSSSQVLESNFQVLNTGEGGGVAENLAQQKFLIQMGEITMKHLGMLSEVYKEKLRLIDAEVRQRKRSGKQDAKSNLGRETVGAFLARSRGKIEKMQSSEHQFLVQAILEEGGGGSFPSKAPKPALVSPNPFEDVGRGDSGDLVLPHIGKKPTPRVGSRRGGGFMIGGEKSKEKLRQAMSAPTGLVEILTAEDKAALAEHLANQEPHSITPGTPGSIPFDTHPEESHSDDDDQYAGDPGAVTGGGVRFGGPSHLQPKAWQQGGGGGAHSRGSSGGGANFSFGGGMSFNAMGGGSAGGSFGSRGGGSMSFASGGGNSGSRGGEAGTNFSGKGGGLGATLNFGTVPASQGTSHGGGMGRRDSSPGGSREEGSSRAESRGGLGEMGSRGGMGSAGGVGVRGGKFP